MTNATRWTGTCVALRALVPGFEVRAKESNRLFVFISALMFWLPAGETWLYSYWHMGLRRVWAPTAADAEGNSWARLQHEGTHLLDLTWLFGLDSSNRLPVWLKFIPFSLIYVFPHWLVVGVFAFPWLGWWALAFLVFLAPWPKPGLLFVEARAYRRNVEIKGGDAAAAMRYADGLTDGSYYWACPWFLRARLAKSLQKPSPYGIIWDRFVAFNE